MNRDRVGVTISVLFILSTALAFFVIIFCRPYFGDDILSQYFYFLDEYLDGKNVTDLIKIESIDLWIKNSIYIYINWSGRIPYLIIYPLICVADKVFISLLIVLINSVNIILFMSICFGSFKESLLHPIAYAVSFPLVLLYFQQLSNMWTFTSIYGISTLLYMLVLKYTLEKVLKGEAFSIKSVVGINIIGLFAGASHELVGPWFVIQIAIIILHKYGIKGSVKQLKYYVGVGLGLFACVFAPGNYVRLKQSHESAIRTVSFYSRLKQSFIRHTNPFYLFSDLGKYVVVLFMVLTILSLGIALSYHDYKHINLLFSLIICEVLSILMWSVVAKTTPYSLGAVLLYKMMIYSYSLEYIFYRINVRYVFVVCGLWLCVVLFDCVSWIPSLIKDTIIRQKYINEAIMNNKQKVVIPCYSKNVNRKIIYTDYTDNSENYANRFVMDYYGIRIIVDHGD